MKNYFIYVIQMGDKQYFKIGVTNDLERRVKDLQTGNPLPLHIIDSFNFVNRENKHWANQIEKVLHRRFDYCRQMGEWFEFTEKELVIIKEMSSKFGYISTNEFTFDFMWEIAC